MTQSLIGQNFTDLKTLLETKTETSSKQTLPKNYNASLSNGKSFNDIFFNANNNYATNSTKSNINNNPLDRLKDNSNKKDYSDNMNLVKDDRFAKDSTNVQKRDESGLRDNRDSQQNRDDSKNDELNSASNKVEDKVTDTKTTNQNDKTQTDESNTVVIKDSFNLDALENVSLDDIAADEDILAYVDITEETLDLITPIIESTETLEPETVINAYYQSALDTFNSESVSSNTLEPAADVLETANVISTTTLDTVETDVESDLTVVDTVLDKTTEKVDTTKISDKTFESQEITEESLKTAETEADIEDVKTDLKAEVKTEKTEDVMEVDSDIKEETTNSDDILVEVADEVMDELPKVDVTQTDKKANAREALEKAGLGEAELDSLNVTVTSVGNSSTDLSNGFGSQTSAQEDLMKLSLQGDSKNQQAAQTDKSFSKMVDSAKAEDPKEISKKDILAQISNKMQAQNINGKNKITLMLTPESLGKVTIELTKGKNGMEARLLTDNAQVKELLEKNIDGLKTVLGNQGVSMNNVSVKVASASESSNGFLFDRGTNGEESFSQQEQNSNGANDKQDSKSQFGQGKFETESDEILAEGEELASDGEKDSSVMGNVDIEV